MELKKQHYMLRKRSTEYVEVKVQISKPINHKKRTIPARPVRPKPTDILEPALAKDSMETEDRLYCGTKGAAELREP